MIICNHIVVRCGMNPAQKCNTECLIFSGAAVECITLTQLLAGSAVALPLLSGQHITEPCSRVVKVKPLLVIHLGEGMAAIEEHPDRLNTSLTKIRTASVGQRYKASVGIGQPLHEDTDKRYADKLYTAGFLQGIMLPESTKNAVGCIIAQSNIFSCKLITRLQHSNNNTRERKA